MNIQAYYVTLSDFEGIGLGHACDPGDFDAACNAYAEQREAGREAVVFRIDPPLDGKAGMATDVTADAEQRIAAWCSVGPARLPEWLLEVVA